MQHVISMKQHFLMEYVSVKTPKLTSSNCDAVETPAKSSLCSSIIPVKWVKSIGHAILNVCRIKLDFYNNFLSYNFNRSSRQNRLKIILPDILEVGRYSVNASVGIVMENTYKLRLTSTCLWKDIFYTN